MIVYPNLGSTLRVKSCDVTKALHSRINVHEVNNESDTALDASTLDPLYLE